MGTYKGTILESNVMQSNKSGCIVKDQRYMKPTYFSQGFAAHNIGRKKKLPQERLFRKCIQHA